MGVKRRLVDQGLWFNAGVIVVPWHQKTVHLWHRDREIRPATDLDARLPMHGARNLNPVITLKNLLPPGSKAFSFSCLVGKAHHVESFAEMGIVAA